MWTSNGIQTPQAHAAKRKAIGKTMSESALDFKEIVWPLISQVKLIGGGELKPVEAVTSSGFCDQLDLIAGIDAWQVLSEPAAIRGLASRIQWKEKSWDSFTIRTRQGNGGETEYTKRERAIAHAEEGHLFPHLTIQAYLDQKRGKLLSAAVIRTMDLIQCATSLMQANLGDSLDFRRRPNKKDGSEFFFISWSYLQAHGIEVERI